MTEESRPEQVTEDDHDVLTYTQVEGRLMAEIAATEAELTGLRASPEARSEEGARLLRDTERRLELLRTAARRNTRRAGTGQGAPGFLGYSGPGSPG